MTDSTVRIIGSSTFTKYSVLVIRKCNQFKFRVTLAPKGNAQNALPHACSPLTQPTSNSKFGYDNLHSLFDRWPQFCSASADAYPHDLTAASSGHYLAISRHGYPGRIQLHDVGRLGPAETAGRLPLVLISSSAGSSVREHGDASRRLCRWRWLRRRPASTQLAHPRCRQHSQGRGPDRHAGPGAL